MREGVFKTPSLFYTFKNMKYFSTHLFLLILLLAGCRATPEEFTLVYSMESMSNYKMSIEIDKDKNYSIRKQNIFFDSYARKERINTSEGKMTDEEYAILTKLIARSRLFRMKDAYGFGQEIDPDNPFDGLIYQLTYTKGKKTKYISIRTNPKDSFPEPFRQLIRFLSNYISKNSPVG